VRRSMLAEMVLAVSLLAGVTLASAQDGRSPEMLAGGTNVTSGALEYRSHCAQCHGPDGKGDGPVSAALIKKPADLTVLAKNNGGVFPADRVRSFIDGSETVTAHGTREMPIWGLEFSKPRPGAPRRSTQHVEQRISLLMSYLQSIQTK
jgi:mono/diheme cytochrome c family protein